MTRWLDQQIRRMRRFDDLLAEAEAIPLPDPRARDRIAHWRSASGEALTVLSEVLERLRREGSG